MKYKLHNKYEITLNNKTYTLYNTLLDTIYEKIANLEQFTSHIAIGTGTTQKTTKDTKLNNYLMSFKTTTDEIQSDISKGDLFIKKIVTIDENFTETFSFSELGITNTNEFDPIIFNHVLIKNQEGEAISITRNPGDTLEIKVTIYLELSTESKSLFINGDNELIKQILGEELSVEDNNIYATRGNNTLTNESLNKFYIDSNKLIKCTKKVVKNSNNSISVNYTAELGEGETEEVFVVYNNKVCLRLNISEFNTPLEITNIFTPEEGNYIEVDKNVKEIISVSDSNNTFDSSYKIVNYSTSLNEKLTNLFDQNFSSNTPRYVSKDSKMIGFVLNNYLNLYKYNNYNFEKINTVQVDTSNIFKLFMFEDILLILKTTEPFVNIYKIIDNNAIKQEVSLAMFESSIYSFDWIDADATLTNNNKILIGVIINNASLTPITIKLSVNSEGIYTDDIIIPSLETAKKVFSVYKNNYIEPKICFITDTYAGGTYYLTEEIYENSKNFALNTDISYKTLYNSKNIYVAGRTLISEKDVSPYIKVFYYPNLIEANSEIPFGTKHFYSKDGNYLISKYSDNTYKIFNFHKLNSLLEFPLQFPDSVSLDNIEDFEFVGDYLLVFTSNEMEPLYFLSLKNNNTRIENLTNNSLNHTINYIKYNLLGSKTLEGVEVNFTLTFGNKED